MAPRRLAAAILLPVMIAFALRPLLRTPGHPKSMNDDEAELTGRSRPRQIPKDWVGEPLPSGEGWRWSDPHDRGNAVRIHRGRPDAPNPVDRSSYVVVTVKGELIDAEGRLTGEYLRD